MPLTKSQRSAKSKAGTLKSGRDTKLDRHKKKAAPKKKIGGATAKPKAKAVGRGAADHWFAKLSKPAQAEYIKAHPNSKYAKGAKAKAIVKSAAKSPASIPAAAIPAWTPGELRDHGVKMKLFDKKRKAHTKVVDAVWALRNHKANKKPKNKVTHAAKTEKLKASVARAREQLKRAEEAHKEHGKKLREKAAKKKAAAKKKPTASIKKTAAGKVLKKDSAGKALKRMASAKGKAGGKKKAEPTLAQKNAAKKRKVLSKLSIAQRQRVKEMNFHPKIKKSKRGMM